MSELDPTFGKFYPGSNVIAKYMEDNMDELTKEHPLVDLYKILIPTNNIDDAKLLCASYITAFYHLHNKYMNLKNKE